MSLITEDFTVRVSDADESAPADLDPPALVELLAARKGGAVFAESAPGDTVIAADTVVVVDGEVLGKPRSPEEAARMLRRLSGRTHSVYTGVYLRRGNRTVSFACETAVTFYPLSEEEIAAYIATGEPFDKAGGYGIQGRGALLVKGIEGDYCNVVGLPVAEVSRALKGLQA